MTHGGDPTDAFQLERNTLEYSAFMTKSETRGIWRSCPTPTSTHFVELPYINGPSSVASRQFISILTPASPEALSVNFGRKVFVFFRSKSLEHNNCMKLA